MSFCFCPLRSGSSGNALFVQAGRARVLVDAGLSGKRIECALGEIGVAPETLTGIIVSHEHSDHIQGAGVLSRRYDLPLYATKGTWRAMAELPTIQRVADKNRREFGAGDDFYIRDLAIAPFAIPHDAAEPVGFALLHAGRKICIATDLGHIAPGWMQALRGADLVLLEANHDPDKLRDSTRYNARLKSRILGRHGHLSNGDCGQALVQLAQSGVRRAILGHMSEETNTPELAFTTVSAALQEAGVRPSDMRVDLAYRDKTGGLYEVGE
ncbi:MAG: MBL fold metallo-hydrolase [Oscillospiraceae bacterium]|nr:MBL fold metallo-hydrolase [Oscillospiraceae bacterium]